MKTMSELTREVQSQIGREDTLRLLVRSGQAHRKSGKEFAPIHFLEFMQHRLQQGWPVEKIVSIGDGKLIQLTRKFQQKKVTDGL